jgi:hypothetical protein
MYLIEFSLSKITTELSELEQVGMSRDTDYGFVKGAMAALRWMAEGDLSPSQQLVKSEGPAHVG